MFSTSLLIIMIHVLKIFSAIPKSMLPLKNERNALTDHGYFPEAAVACHP